MIRAWGLAVAIVALWGCSQEKPAKPVETAKPAESGRWVIVHSEQVERDTILLDTATGRTWSRVQVGDLTDEPAAWDPMPQLNSDADYAALRARHPPNPNDTGGFTRVPPSKVPSAGPHLRPVPGDPWKVVGETPAPQS